MDITLCVICNKFQYKNKWVSYSNIKDPINQIIKDKVKINLSYRLKRIKIEPLLPDFKKGPGLKLQAEAKLTIIASAQGFKQDFSEQYIIPIKLNFSYCPKCGKSGTQYFEAILQIRNPHQEVIEYIERTIKTHQKKGVFVTKTQKTKSGIDYYLTDINYTKGFAQGLKAKFGGELKISPRLHTRDKQTSREVYRVSALLRLPDFKKGDVVLVETKPVLITNMGKKIMAKDLLSKKQIAIDIKKQKPKALEVYKTSVSKIHPGLEVIHPETYQSTKIENPKKLELGQNIRVVIANKKLFLVD